VRGWFVSPPVATKIVQGRTFASMLASVPLLHQRRRAVTDVSKSDRRSLFTGPIAGRCELARSLRGISYRIGLRIAAIGRICDRAL
jgi:hypothetical protein